MMARRQLVVTADDYGQSPGTTYGAVEAHAHGIVTSASLMVRHEAAGLAAAFAAEHPRLAVGLHVDLGEWACSDGDWQPLYEVVCLEDGEAIRAEVARQLAAFRTLLRRDPTHLDSHQHVHRREPVRSALVEIAGRLGVPLRECTAGIDYCGAFYGQTEHGAPQTGAVAVDALLALIAALPPGTTELGCHPATSDDAPGMYCVERPVELSTLCDPRVREALRREGVALRSFGDFRC